MLRIRHSGNIRVKERASSMILPDLFMGEIGSACTRRTSRSMEAKIRHHGSGLAAAAECLDIEIFQRPQLTRRSGCVRS